jgi:GTP-binding nuclear protein Ran
MDKTYKLILIGDAGVGKSTLVKKLKYQYFEKSYVATLGVELFPITFDTNHGKISFSIWDCAGQNKYKGLGEGYYVNSDCIVAMFDLNSKESFTGLKELIESANKVTDGLPLTICANKTDMKRKVHIKGDLKYNYDEISVKDGINIKNPFLYLAKKLSGFDDLEFI